MICVMLIILLCLHVVLKCVNKVLLCRVQGCGVLCQMTCDLLLVSFPSRRGFDVISYRHIKFEFYLEHCFCLPFNTL